MDQEFGAKLSATDTRGKEDRLEMKENSEDESEIQEIIDEIIACGQKTTHPEGKEYRVFWKNSNNKFVFFDTNPYEEVSISFQYRQSNVDISELTGKTVMLFVFDISGEWHIEYSY